MNVWVDMPTLYAAYTDCRKRKRGTPSCAEFELHEALNLDTLLYELNSKTYEIGVSNAFCVTRPKVREVFAANFRDRIVHHLVMMKTMHLFEDEFIDNTFNCRKGKGTAQAHLVARELAAKHPDGWVVNCDIQGFFMAIPKKLLADRLEMFLRERYKGSDLEEIVWLVRMIALHCPEKKCIRKGDLSLWKLLPASKSLFTCGEGLGMAIGNLTSQVFANFFLSPFDHWMEGQGLDYCRFVDDSLAFADDKDVLLKLLPRARAYLRDEFGLTLHPKKVELQPVRRGFPFVGVTVKHGLTYINNRTVGNCYSMIEHYNRKTDEELSEQAEKFVQRYNSYAGYMIHHRTYNIRKRIWSLVDDRVKQFVFINNRLSVVGTHEQYKANTKLKRRYHDLRKHSRRRVQS